MVLYMGLIDNNIIPLDIGEKQKVKCHDDCLIASDCHLDIKKYG